MKLAVLVFRPFPLASNEDVPIRPARQGRGCVRLEIMPDLLENEGQVCRKRVWARLGTMGSRTPGLDAGAFEPVTVLMKHSCVRSFGFLTALLHRR